MCSASRYWQFVRISNQGQREIQVIPAAQAFFQQQFRDVLETGAFEDAAVQKVLVDLMRSPPSPSSVPSTSFSEQQLAECCLRCFISHQGDLICNQLVQQFGQKTGFTWVELYRFLLDADLHPFTQNSGSIQARNQATAAQYQAVATKILHSFDPSQSKLSTWTWRLVSAELNGFLLENGIYLASEWSILNGIEPMRLQRLCQRVHRLSEDQTQRVLQLLEVFHTVYRSDRRQQYSKSSRSKYREPTEEQLQRMVDVLRSQNIDGYTAKKVLQELRELAQLIRKARRPEQISIDDSENQRLVDQQALQEDEEEPGWKGFRNRYQQVMLDCLEQSLGQVVEARVTYLKKRSPKDRDYLIALERFHCKSMTMGAIVGELGWQRQDQVTRLLELKNLRTDVGQVWLTRLRENVQELVITHTDTARLAEVIQQLDAILSEDIAPVLEEAAAEASTPNQPRKSRFAQRLCRYLDTRPDVQQIMGVEIAPLHP